MHDLTTLERINLAAAERELATRYVRACALDAATLPGPGRPFGLGHELRRLGTALLAVSAALLALSCGSVVKHRDPTIAGPCPGPVLAPVGVHYTAEGVLDYVLYREVLR